MSDEQRLDNDPDGLASEVREASEIANRNIQRFLELQAQEKANLIMVAHQQDVINVAKAAAAASELTNANIRRFLDLQGQEKAHLIMVAHQQSLEGREE